jgi:hypothetical protein
MIVICAPSSRCVSLLAIPVPAAPAPMMMMLAVVLTVCARAARVPTVAAAAAAPASPRRPRRVVLMFPLMVSSPSSLAFHDLSCYFDIVIWFRMHHAPAHAGMAGRRGMVIRNVIVTPHLDQDQGQPP